MADFMEKLEDMIRSLNKKMARFNKNKGIIDEVKAISALVRAQNLKLEKEAAKLPTEAVTDLEPSEIPKLFSLKRDEPTDQELWPTDDEKVSLPSYLESLLADYELATGDSPPNEALLRSRIDVIVLSTLAKMKLESVSNPRLSIGSVLSTDTIKSLHLQFERSIKRPWQTKDKRFLLSGVVDYSLWFGTPQDYETNLVMVQAKKAEFLKGGVLQCLAYMGMIHHARKTSKMHDTSVYGVVTDSFDWEFIHIRANGQSAAGSSTQSQRNRWRQGSEIDFTTELEKFPKSPKT
ncbi:uncharacterized protein N7479_006505 [Penicillium vulpinum]|uniref:Uncharacterized protein n=1 Tax=Penicillium vulpinum TaxID=29845 RepID=A0A1V6S2H8_9EURO|nr:uncharacterized protein N7479_006505 [Penicillium vulpinum]KAJ5959355.1 hypothetical protein N7479_006505 [Penicillium vulpinum]OQE07944.1 hypothetical protein PENVUL_c011G00934 [Penicillium vulpinum]